MVPRATIQKEKMNSVTRDQVNEIVSKWKQFSAFKDISSGIKDVIFSKQKLQSGGIWMVKNKQKKNLYQ